jgi:hypothetical protein
MSRYDQNGFHIPTTIFEAAAWKHSIKAECLCPHWAVFDPHALWWLFHRKGWSDHFQDAAPRFRCTLCSRRRARLYLVREETTRPLPMPSETDWKRAVARFRS